MIERQTNNGSHSTIIGIADSPSIGARATPPKRVCCVRGEQWERDRAVYPSKIYLIGRGISHLNCTPKVRGTDIYSSLSLSILDLTTGASDGEYGKQTIVRRVFTHIPPS